MGLALRYALFAVLAMAANIGAQMLSFLIYAGPHAIFPAMAAGTLVGVVVKYQLDRRWIFHQGRASLAAHSRTFSLYSLTAIPTTALFWLTEWAFDAYGGTAAWRYAGALVGLSLGYLIKYQLDRRFVFGVGR